MNIQCIGSGSAGNAYLLEDGNTSILLECGLQFRKIQEAIGFHMSDIKGCLITHEHQDHCRSVKKLMDRGVDVYCTAGTAQVLGILDNPYCNSLPAYQDIFNIGTLRISAFPTVHDAIEPCGYVIYSTITREKLLFLTDTKYCTYSFSGITHIMIECNYDDETFDKSECPLSLKKRILNSHMSLKNCIHFLTHVNNDFSKVDTIYILHLSDRNSDEERMKRKVAEATGKIVVVF